MNLKVIGTGAISSKEKSACSLIDGKILIDCGNGTVKTLLQQNVDVDKIEVLLITHLHADHFFDLPFLILQKYFSCKTKKFYIFCPVGTEKAVREMTVNFLFSDWDTLLNKTNTKFFEFEKLDNQEICEGYFATSYEVSHGDFYPAFGFVVKNNHRAIGFSGDSSICENIEKIVKISNISVLDMSSLKGDKSHMGIDNIKALSKKYNKKIVPTHMRTESREYATTNIIDNILLLNDGDEINI